MTPPDSISAVPAAPSCVTPPDRHQWFVDQVHPHDHQLKNYLRSQFPKVRDIDDVVQESYLKVWRARAAHPIDSAKAFLFKVARNLALNVIRRDRRSPIDFDGAQTETHIVEDSRNPLEALSEQEKLDLLTDALAELTTKTRSVMLLHKIDGLTQGETARTLGLTEKAVANHVARGVQHCAEFIGRTIHER
jgi:RNA polymerase sigma factor (sigma-70 family)